MSHLFDQLQADVSAHLEAQKHELLRSRAVSHVAELETEIATLQSELETKRTDLVQFQAEVDALFPLVSVEG